MFYSLEQLMWSGLRQVERELQSLLQVTSAWSGFEEDSVVRVRALATRVSFFHHSGILVLTKFCDVGSQTFRRYRAPYVLKVLKGSYFESSSNFHGSRPPRILAVRNRLTAGDTYGCFSPYRWHSLELDSPIASNLVLVGPRFTDVQGQFGFGNPVTELSVLRRNRLLAEFRREMQKS